MDNKRMRVAVYYSNHDVRIEERPIPQIGPGEILIKVMASGICGSDVLEWYRKPKAPLVLGHEVTGIIVATGEGVENCQVGDAVFVSHHVPCNTCYLCLNDHHTACKTLHSTNYDPGGFAEFIRVPAINVDRGLFPLPDGVSFDEGVFIEPLACCVRAQRLANVRPGQTILILGGGIAGLLHLLLGQATGVGLIAITEIDPYRREIAQKLGAHAVFPADCDLSSELRKINHGRLADTVIVCAGAKEAYSQALRSVGEGGTILCFATTEPGIDLPLPINEFWRKEIRLLTSYGNAPRDALIALELLTKKRLDVLPLITHRIPLEETGKGFALVAQGGRSLKVIIKPHGSDPQT